MRYGETVSGYGVKIQAIQFLTGRVGDRMNEDIQTVPTRG